MLIYWEKLLWTVDGINKTYTAQNTIDTTVELRIGWAPYVAFTVSWRIITLTDAIPAWEEVPELDYYYIDNLVSVTNTDVTVNDALNWVLDAIGITAFNTSYKQATALKYVNECYFTNVNRNKDVSIKWSYWFTKGWSYTYWTFYRWDIIPVSETMDNYTPREWKILLNWLVVDFTTRTDSNITLPDWLTTTAENWDIILFWYKLQPDMYEISYITVNGIPYKRKSKEDFGKWVWYNEFMVFEWYLFISRSDSEQVVVHYTRKNQLFTTVGDIIDMPGEYLDYLSLYAAYKMTRFREDDRSRDIEEEYNKIRKKYNAFRLRQSKWLNSFWNFNWPLNWL